MLPTVLAIETATDVCGVALHHDGQLVTNLALYRSRVHAEHLTPLIGDALRYAGLEPHSIDTVAVSSGPGSYTGLRIGTSTAKGFALAVGAKLVAVPSLEAQAARIVGYTVPGDLICAAFNARRDEVYSCVFRVDTGESLFALGEPAALAVTDLATWLPIQGDGRLWLVGEGAPRLVLALEPTWGPRIMRPDSAVNVPSAASVARLALVRIAASRYEEIPSFEPYYLKDFVARKPTRSLFERLPF